MSGPSHNCPAPAEPFKKKNAAWRAAACKMLTCVERDRWHARAVRVGRMTSEEFLCHLLREAGCAGRCPRLVESRRGNSRRAGDEREGGGQGGQEITPLFQGRRLSLKLYHVSEQRQAPPTSSGSKPTWSEVSTWPSNGVTLPVRRLLLHGHGTRLLDQYGEELQLPQRQRWQTTFASLRD